MRYFILLVDPDGRGIPGAVRRVYEMLPRSRTLSFRWQSFAQAAVLTAWNDDAGDSPVASDGEHLAVGTVRLDNRPDVKRWLGSDEDRPSDLGLVLHTVARFGSKRVGQLIGDFGFVVWHAPSRTLLAASDPFALMKLYFVERHGLLCFGSRAEALALEDRYEPQYLAELVASCNPTPGLCVYAGIRSVPSGSMMVLERGRLVTSSYWSAEELASECAWKGTEQDAIERCRDLFSESIRLRLGLNGDTWSQLSGGLDSSSIASAAQWLVEQGMTPHGLAGTVTYVDRQGSESDERMYSDAVVGRWGLRNESIVEPSLWTDEEYPPPYTDQPRMDYPFYPREQRLCAIVKAAGGRVVLTGIGGDELFSGYTYFLADWLVRGRAWAAVREMTQRAVAGRVSFWALAYHDVLLPLLPAGIRNRLVHAGGHVPDWISDAAIQGYELRSRTFAAAFQGGRPGHKYQHGVSTGITGLGRLIEPGVVGDAFDVRHPFLYRPLVEFASQLPPELCARPHQRKWVLREAMRGILPERVRTRVGKGGPAEMYAWSLATLRRLLEPLVRDSTLAQLGVVNATNLRVAFDGAPHQPHDERHQHAMLYSTLAIEAWLQVRSGQWPRGNHRSTTAAHA